MNESLNFCAMYLCGIETRFNRDERNNDRILDNDVCGEFEVFTQNARPIGTSTLRTLSVDEKRIAQWYILNNCPQLEPYRRKHLRQIRQEAQNSSDLKQMHKQRFPDWFKSQVCSI